TFTEATAGPADRRAAARRAGIDNPRRARSPAQQRRDAERRRDARRRRRRSHLSQARFGVVRGRSRDTRGGCPGAPAAAAAAPAENDGEAARVKKRRIRAPAKKRRVARRRPPRAVAAAPVSTAELRALRDEIDRRMRAATAATVGKQRTVATR